VGKAEQTTDWYSYRHVRLGKIEIAQAGRHELAVRAHPSAPWKPINIRSIKLTRIP
jgi:hypothetical protein